MLFPYNALNFASAKRCCIFPLYIFRTIGKFEENEALNPQDIVSWILDIIFFPKDNVTSYSFFGCFIQLNLRLGVYEILFGIER